jgi:hypothetical protein
MDQPGAALTRRRFIGAAASAIAGLTVLGTPRGSGASGSRATGKLKISLANSFIGNMWRLELENTYRAPLAAEPCRSPVVSFDNIVTAPGALQVNMWHSAVAQCNTAAILALAW